MPGPMSSPNGKLSVDAPRDMSKRSYVSGKTAYKRGQIGHAGKEGEIRRQKLSRARREEQEAE